MTDRIAERTNNRAAACLFLAFGFLVASGFLFASVPSTVTEASAVSDAQVCPAYSSHDDDCLVRETGRLFGPYSTRRDPGDDWVFQPGGSVEQEHFGLAPLESQQAEQLPATVTALRWHGETVALVTEDGRRIVTEGFHSPVAIKLYLGLITLGMAGMFATSGFVVRRSPEGWTVRPREPSFNQGPPVSMHVAGGTATAGGIGMFAIAMGGSTSLSVILVLAVTCLTGAMVVRTQRRCRRRP